MLDTNRARELGEYFVSDFKAQLCILFVPLLRGQKKSQMGQLVEILFVELIRSDEGLKLETVTF